MMEEEKPQPIAFCDDITVEFAKALRPGSEEKMRATVTAKRRAQLKSLLNLYGG